MLITIYNNAPRRREAFTQEFGLLFKGEVNMAGLQSQSCFCVFMDRVGVEVLNFHRKKNKQEKSKHCNKLEH